MTPNSFRLRFGVTQFCEKKPFLETPLSWYHSGWHHLVSALGVTFLYGNACHHWSHHSGLNFSVVIFQNYKQTLSAVLDRKQKHPHYLFTDHSFPPCEKVLVRNDSVEHVFWRRPHVCLIDNLFICYTDTIYMIKTF